MFLKEFAQNLLYVAGIYAHTSEEHTILHNRCYTNCKQVSKHSLNNLFLVLTWKIFVTIWFSKTFSAPIASSNFSHTWYIPP